jgi:hypothetical protein
MIRNATTYEEILTSPEARAVLKALLDAKLQLEQGWLSAAQISKILRDVHGVKVHWRTVRNLLSENQSLVDRRKRKGRFEFCIMKAGEYLLAESGSEIVIVDPNEATRATLSLHALLGSLVGVVRVCDPYFDYRTVEHLEVCKLSSRLRLLTKNVKDTGPLRRLTEAAARSGWLEVRVASNAPLHDRYIIDNLNMYLLGTSLNGFGKTQSFVAKTGTDVRSLIIPAFDNYWASAPPWP